MALIEKFESQFGIIEFTDEREAHIFRFHPEVRKYRRHFAWILLEPEEIRRSKYDPAVAILYRKIKRHKYLAIVVKTNQRNFILTAYLVTKSPK